MVGTVPKYALADFKATAARREWDPGGPVSPNVLAGQQASGIVHCITTQIQCTQIYCLMRNSGLTTGENGVGDQQGQHLAGGDDVVQGHVEGGLSWGSGKQLGGLWKSEK